MADAESGVVSRAGEWVYPADILADSALNRAELVTFGAWMKTLLHLWREKNASLSATASGWARLWGCSEDEAARILSQLAELRIAEVSSSDDCVTVTCRRLLRRERSLQIKAERMRRQRSHAARGEDVAATCPDNPWNKKETTMATAATTEEHPPTNSAGEDAKLERFNRLWWLCRGGQLKELTFRRGRVKAKVLDASPEAITLEYPHASLGGRRCRALLLPAEVDIVEESLA